MANNVVRAQLVADPTLWQRGFGQAEGTVAGFRGKVTSAAAAASAAVKAYLAVEAVGAVGRFVDSTVDSFSNLEQSVGGTEAVFGNASDAIDKFARGSAQAIGLSEAEFRTATTLIGGQLKRMTGDVDLASQKSIELTQIAADLAATYGGTTKEAVEALGSAFRGEADPAERFNLDLKIGRVNAKAVELGLAETTSKVDDYAKAQATLALITEQSADAQGQFAREADTVAGQTQRATAALEDQKALLGSQIARPWIEIQTGAMKGFGQFITELSNEIGMLTGDVSEAEAALAEWQITNGRAAQTVDDARQVAEDFGVSVRDVAEAMGLVDIGANRHRGSAEKLRESFKQTSEAADELTQEEEELREKTEELRAEYESALTDMGRVSEQTWPQITGDVEDFLTGFEKAPERVDISMGEFMENFQQRRQQMADFWNGIKTLADQGFAGLANEIAQEGPAALGLLEQYLADPAQAKIDNALVTGAEQGIAHLIGVVRNAEVPPVQIPVTAPEIRWTVQPGGTARPVKQGSRIFAQEGGIARARPGGVDVTTAEAGSDEALIPFDERGRKMLADVFVDAIRRSGLAGAGGNIVVQVDGQTLLEVIRRRDRSLLP